MSTETREMPPLELRATFLPETVDEQARTVELVWTTGARVLRGFWERYWEELSLKPEHVRLGRLNSGAPFLRDHEAWSTGAVMGVVERARLEPGRGVAVVRFARAEDDAEADAIFRKVKDGILRNVSVGYRVHRMVKLEEELDKVPVFRAEDWEPYEISIVPVGADAGAGFRAHRHEPNPCEIISRGQQPQKESNMPEEKRTQGETAPTAPVVDPEKVLTEERKRVADITALVRKAQLGEEVADDLVSRGATVEAARAVVLEKLMERSSASGPSQAPSGAVEMGTSERDKRLRAMEAWLLERAGVADLIEQARGRKRFGRHFAGVVLDGGEFRGLSLMDLARECLERSGVKTRGMDRMTLVGRAFTERSGGYQGTPDFGVLMENILHKMVIAAYATAPDTWRLFCGRDTVTDFRPHNRYRNGSFGTLDHLNEHGEFKNKAIPDGQKYTITTETRGNIIALTRQAIINDDMGAFADMATRYGRSAGLSIEVDVYNLLKENSGLGPTWTDSQPFFHANRSNVNATGSALTVAGLDADRLVLAQQKDTSNNEFLDLRPAVLVLPIGLGGEARVINQSQHDTDPVAANATNKFMKPNKVVGLFQTIVDTPRLSGTRRYLFADPAIAPVIKVVFLEGSGEAPVIEQKDGWRVDGTEWKLRMDFEAQMFDWKGAVTNAGA